VIPIDWLPYRRPADGELVGYLVASDLDPELTTPTSLIGIPLGLPQPHRSAQDVLATHGLAVLAERWWCQLPTPLPRTPLTIGAPEPDWTWRSVVLVEASPAECRIRPELAWPEELTAQVTVPVPVGNLLRAAAPV